MPFGIYAELPVGWIQVTASAGVTAVRLGDTAHPLVERAGRMLCAAKEAGRNCLRCDGLESGAAYKPSPARGQSHLY